MSVQGAWFDARPLTRRRAIFVRAREVETAMDMTTSFVDIGEARLEYHRRRPGRPAHFVPVVLLHPWRGCWQFWNHTVAGLPERDCYAVDLYSPGRNGN